MEFLLCIVMAWSQDQDAKSAEIVATTHEVIFAFAEAAMEVRIDGKLSGAGGSVCRLNLNQRYRIELRNDGEIVERFDYLARKDDKKIAAEIQLGEETLMYETSSISRIRRGGEPAWIGRPELAKETYPDQTLALGAQRGRVERMVRLSAEMQARTELAKKLNGNVKDERAVGDRGGVIRRKRFKGTAPPNETLEVFVRKPAGALKIVGRKPDSTITSMNPNFVVDEHLADRFASAMLWIDNEEVCELVEDEYDLDLGAHLIDIRVDGKTVHRIYYEVVESKPSRDDGTRITAYVLIGTKKKKS